MNGAISGTYSNLYTGRQLTAQNLSFVVSEMMARVNEDGLNYGIVPDTPHSKLPLRQAAPRPPPSREGKQPDGSYVIEVGPNETHEDAVRRHPDVLFIHRESGDVLFKRGDGPVIVRPREQ